MGIGYNDSIVLYNRYEDEDTGEEHFFGKLFENVRIEITQGESTTKQGKSSSDSVTVKIPNPAQYPYLPPDQWEEEKESTFTVNLGNNDFFTISAKRELNINTQPLTGQINSSEYSGGFYEYMKEHGMTYACKTFRAYDLIPRIEIGGV